MNKFINIQFKGEMYPASIWSREKSFVGSVLSIDTETDLIREGEVPSFALASVFNGKKVFFVKKKDLRDFFELHAKSTKIFANAAFDLEVIAKSCEFSPFHQIENGNTFDILLLYKLYKIADIGSLVGKDKYCSLAYLSSLFLNVDLDKSAKERLNFGDFIQEDGRVLYSELTLSHLEYAGRDALATYFIWEKLREKILKISYKNGVDLEKWLSHGVQLKADFALSRVSRLGLFVDETKRSQIFKTLCKEIEREQNILFSFGYEKGRKGNTSILQEQIKKEVQKYSLAVPYKQKIGLFSTKFEDWEDHIESIKSPFLHSYFKLKEKEKMQTFVAGKSEVVRPYFSSIVSTGRTSSSNPNVQNFPRSSEIRSIFSAPKGHLICSTDFSKAELVCFSQVTFDLFGFSQMRDLLNQGIDPHTLFASKIRGCPLDQVSKEDRRKAKACNFGFLGGMGSKSFRDYAKTTYKIDLSEQEAESLKDLWHETFPETKKYLQQEDENFFQKRGLERSYNTCVPKKASWPLGSKIWALRNILSGKKRTKSGKAYLETEIKWAFNLTKKYSFPEKERFEKDILKRRGSYALARNFERLFRSVIIPSGRVRGCVTYTQSKNTPFQGLAADGAKLALYELIKEGFKVFNFIHDEYLIYLPIDSNLKSNIDKIEKIAIGGMKEVCPDVEVKVDTKLQEFWGGPSLNVEEVLSGLS